MKLRDRWLFHSTSLTTVTFVITYIIEYPYLSWPGLVQISLNVARLHLQNCALAHWFTTPFLLVRGKGLGMRLMRDYLSKLWHFSIKPISKNSGKTTINLPHVNLIIFSASADLSSSLWSFTRQMKTQVFVLMATYTREYTTVLWTPSSKPEYRNHFNLLG